MSYSIETRWKVYDGLSLVSISWLYAGVIHRGQGGREGDLRRTERDKVTESGRDTEMDGEKEAEMPQESKEKRRRRNIGR